MKKFIIALLSALLAVSLFTTYTMFKDEGEKARGSRSIGRDTDLIHHQKKVKKVIHQSYRQATYNFRHPLLLHDPYGEVPLSALVKFKTKHPVKVSLTVKGKSAKTNITKTFKGYKKNHQIPVLGLYPDYKNTVILTGKKKNGQTMKKQIHVKTDPLPEDFLHTELVKSKPDKMEDGLTFITPSSAYPYAVDQDGEVRWFSTLPNSHVFKRLNNGHLLYLSEKHKYNLLLEMDMLGHVYHAYHVNLSDYDGWGVIHHDAVQLPNKNFLVTTTDTSPYVEDDMVEIDRKTGKPVHELNMRDFFPESFYEDYDGPEADENDWFHQNAIWYNHKNDSILVSSRHQSAVMEMNYPDGKIHWILAAHEGWSKAYQKYLLQPIGDNFKFPGGQHAVMKLPDQDGNPDTTDIMLFDNNITITRGDKAASKKYSRGVQYRINTKDMTVKQIWAYGKERGKTFFSSIIGDANYLPHTKNRLITSGYNKDEDGNLRSIVTETTDGQPADVVYELKITGFQEDSHRQVYRAIRMPLYPDHQAVQ